MKHAKGTVMRTGAFAAAVTAVVFASWACTAVDTVGAWDAPASVVLRLGTPSPQGSRSGDDAEYFAATLDEETAGAVRVEVGWDAGNEFTPPGAPGMDHSVITMLREGTIDLALVPARAWDQIGETTFRTLQTPFLIPSDAAAAAVARSDAALSMLARLSSSGLVGLAVIPEGLRHVASFDRPLLQPSDFLGVQTRAPLSASTYEALGAIGLRPVDLSAEEFSRGTETGEIGAAEAGFADYTALPSAVVYTGNVTPYAEFDVLAMREVSLVKLQPELRGLMQTVAHRTLDHSLATSEGDAAAAEAYCRRGGAVVLAPASTLAAFESGARPVVERLERDPATGPALDAIRNVVAAVPVGDSVPGCVPASPARPATFASRP